MSRVEGSKIELSDTYKKGGDIMKCLIKVFTSEDCDIVFEKEKLVLCKECWFREIVDDGIVCTNPHNGGWRHRKEDDFCSFAEEGTYETKEKKE